MIDRRTTRALGLTRHGGACCEEGERERNGGGGRARCWVTYQWKRTSRTDNGSTDQKRAGDGSKQRTNTAVIQRIRKREGSCREMIRWRRRGLFTRRGMTSAVAVLNGFVFEHLPFPFSTRFAVRHGGLVIRVGVHETSVSSIFHRGPLYFLYIFIYTPQSASGVLISLSHGTAA